MNLFNRSKKSKTRCSFCKKEVDKSSSFVLQYKAADGVGNMDICLECSNILNNIIDDREVLFDE
jgi:hypothetical protein